jgi:hypothetical protein
LDQSSVRTELTRRAPSIGEDEERPDVVRSGGVDSGMSSAIMRLDLQLIKHVEE